LSRIFMLLNWIFILGLLVSYLSVFINPRSFVIPAFFGLAYPYFFFINVIFIIAWIINRKYYFVYALLALLIGWNYPGKYIQVRGKQGTAPETGQFTVMTYNVQNLAGNNWNLPNNEITDQIKEFLKKTQVDILCLQEFSVYKQDVPTLLNNFSKELNFPYIEYARYINADRTKFDIMVLFSRHPVIHSFILPKEDNRNLGLFSDVVIDHDTIRVFNVHLESIRFKAEDIDFITEMELQNADEDSFAEGSKKVISKLSKAFQIRAGQAVNLKSYMDSSPYPVILCGDFNDSPVSFSYHKIAAGLQDAFIESGSGFGNTYAGKLPSFRIDYILYDPYFQSINYLTYPVKYSDHFPISCTVFKR